MTIRQFSSRIAFVCLVIRAIQTRSKRLCMIAMRAACLARLKWNYDGECRFKLNGWGGNKRHCSICLIFDGFLPTSITVTQLSPCHFSRKAFTLPRFIIQRWLFTLAEFSERAKWEDLMEWEEDLFSVTEVSWTDPDCIWFLFSVVLERKHISPITDESVQKCQNNR